MIPRSRAAAPTPPGDAARPTAPRSSRAVLVALVAFAATLFSTFGLAVGPADAAPTPGGLTVALVASADPDYTADVQDKLAASGAFAQVTTLPESGCRTGTPTLAELQAYDVAYVWSDCSFSDPAALGDVLAAYVDGGGRVVVSTFALYDQQITGRFAADGYLPTATGSQVDGEPQSLVADLPADPLLAGVTSFDGGQSSYHNGGLTLTDGSTLVAHWTDGEPLVAYRGDVVELNFYPPSSDVRSDFWDSSTDGTRLMINALDGVAAPTQVAPSISSADHASFAVGTAGSVTVTTNGKPTAALSETGALPSGVTFTDNGDGTATLAGTPATGTGGSYPVTIAATNGVSPDASQTFTLTVTELPVVSSVMTAGFTVGAAGSFTVTTTPGYPAATTITASGTLPDGLTVTDNGDGTATVSGTPASGSAGTYPVTVQAANSAGSTSQALTLTVSLAPQTVTFTSTPPAPAGVVGQTYVVSTTGGGSEQPISLAVDEASAKVCSVAQQTVTFAHPGSCVVRAAQAGDGQYAAASASQTIAVSQAATSTALTVRSTGLTATVAPVAPGAGTPTGTVRFAVDGTTVGTAPLVRGRATLPRQVAAGQTRAVSAVYGGDGDFTGSSASTARHDPTITATLSSATGRSSAGWYRGPVTVTFHCTTDGAVLTASCPAAVTLRRSAAGQSVTRTVQAVDGGAATVTVRGINIDRGAPTVAVSGVRGGATYPGQAPAARCAGADALSGIARCTLTRRTSGESVTITATAVDRAGNTRSATVHYSVARFYIAGVAYRDGAYQVREGRTYLVVALTTGTARPRYYDAAPHGRTPAPPALYLHRSGDQSGLHRFTLLVRIDRGLGRYRYWDMGVKTGGTLHRIVFRPAA